ncbi:MAG: DUF1801 domain-containing protein [Fimbriimonadaceae bacterium]|nr:DUF1801 domain-containing protein [Fimbriimonadaceae bacterium]
MRGSVTAATPDEYIASLDEPRRSEIQTLHDLIRETVPHLEPHICSGMIGYGRYHYKGKTCEGEWFLVGLASNKASLSVYSCSADDRGYVAERYRDRLPKANIGKSCIRVKKLADLDLEVVRELIRETDQVGFAF